MYELKTVARPYANALFEIASEQSACQVWFDVLQVLTCFSEQDGFDALVMNPRISLEQIFSLFNDMLVQQIEAAESIQPQIKEFIAVLYNDQRLAALPYIMQIYQQLWVDSLDAVAVEVTSAYDLNDNQQTQFNASLSKRFNATVDITFKTDPTLIGGAVIRRGSWVLDGSIQGKLTSLIDSMRG